MGKRSGGKTVVCRWSPEHGAQFDFNVLQLLCLEWDIVKKAA